MAERSTGPVKPPVIDLTARSNARADADRADKAEAGAAPSPRNDNPPRDTVTEPSRSPRSAALRPGWLPLGAAAIGGAVLGTLLTYLLATAVPLPMHLPPDLSADVRGNTTAITDLRTSLDGLTARATRTQESLDATIAQLDKGFADANAAIAGVKASIPAALPPVDLTPLQTEINTLRGQLDAIGAGASGGDASALGQSIAALQTNLDALTTRLNTADSTIASLRGDVDAVRKGLADKVVAALPADVGPALKLPLLLSGLASAFDTGRPFAGELASLHDIVPDLPIPDALTAAAGAGLVRPDTLTQRFEAALPQILAARDTPGADWTTNAVDFAKSLLALRPAEEIPGDSPDAVVSRLEGAVSRHDYAAAQALVVQLPPAMRTAAAPIAADIAAHAAADDLLVTLRARALSAAEAAP